MEIMIDSKAAPAIREAKQNLAPKDGFIHAAIFSVMVEPTVKEVKFFVQTTSVVDSILTAYQSWGREIVNIKQYRGSTTNTLIVLYK